MNQTGLLPSIAWNGARWWLPLSSSTANQLAQQFLQPDPVVLCTLVQSDPALRIWLLLEYAASVDAASVTLDGLSNSAPSVFAHALTAKERWTDPPTDLQAFHPQWCQLYRDLASWDQPQQWLQITGPEIPEDWRRTWPQLIGAASLPGACPDFGGNRLDLALLLKKSDHFDSQLQQEKLAAMKELAYGLSHEINNPLANISTRAQSLARDERSPDRQRMLGAIVTQAMRAYEMIADMMFFANPPVPKIANDQDPEDVSGLVQQIVDEFTAAAAQQGIEVSSHLVTGCFARIDRGQIADAIRSLLRNAVEAIHPPGQIAIDLARVDGMLRLSITDTGPGLNEREQRHAFDPFFSGREAGRGLGLGLCKAHRVIELAGGEIAIASSLAGCVVTVQIPVAGFEKPVGSAPLPPPTV